MADEIVDDEGLDIADPVPGGALPVISLPGFFHGPAALLDGAFTFVCPRLPPLREVAGTLDDTPATFAVTTVPGFDLRLRPYLIARLTSPPIDLDFRFANNSQFL